MPQMVCKSKFQRREELTAKKLTILITLAIHPKTSSICHAIHVADIPQKWPFVRYLHAHLSTVYYNFILMPAVNSSPEAHFAVLFFFVFTPTDRKAETSDVGR